MRLITHRLSPPARKPDGTGPAHAPGQALVEFALMLPLLLLLAVGILEFGMLFKDHVGIHYASREGARAGASASRNTTADCSILRAVSTTMQTMPYADLQRVRIFKADNGGVCGTPCAEDVYFRTPSPGNTCSGGLDPGASRYLGAQRSSGPAEPGTHRCAGRHGAVPPSLLL